MTQEERREAFRQKAEVGNRRNNASLATEDNLYKRYSKGELSIRDVITLAWSDGCKYGKEHAEELKVFDL
jgi:hypothetical protein